MRISTKTVLLAAVAAMTAGLAEPVFADYPEKPIRIIIPFRAGGGSSALARQFEAAIENHKLLPKPVAIVNVDGAGGTVGARRVKDAKPDGYTFLQIHGALMATAASGRVDFGPEAFEPVITTTRSCVYLAVPASSPYKTYQELVEAGRKDPGKLKQADSIGGITHFAMAALEQATGAKFGIVQTGGTSKRFASMKGGHTQLAFMSTGWIKRGGDQLRSLLYLGDKRLAAAPDMPTAKELGYDVTSCLIRRYWAPKGTPADRIKVFADALEAAANTPELIAFHEKSSQDRVILRGDALKQDIAAEWKQFKEAAPLVKAALAAK